MPRGASPISPLWPARTALTVATARFSACSSSAEAWAKPVGFARDAAQAEALGGVVRGALQLAVVERQALALLVFEEQLAVVAAGERVVDHLLRLAAVETALAEEQVVGGGEMVDRLGHDCLLSVLEREPLAAHERGRVRPSLRSQADDEDDLAKMGIGLHVRKRLGGLSKREGLVDGQRQLARLDGRPQVGAGRLDDGAHLLGRARAEGDADIVDALQRMQVEVELALHAAQPADIDDAAQDGGGLHVLVGDARRHLVDDQVDALAASRLLDLVRPFGDRACRARGRSRTPSAARGGRRGSRCP